MTPTPSPLLSPRSCIPGLALLVALTTCLVLSPTPLVGRNQPDASTSTETPLMEDHTPSSHEVISPAGREFLTCRFLRPADFRRAELPEQEIDFEKHATFLPLAVCIANYGPVVFTVAARPAFEDGSVSDWLRFLAREENFELDEVRTTQIGTLAGVEALVLQRQEDMTVRLRLVLIENGGRLFQLSGMAPVQLWPGAEKVLGEMIASFELAVDQGSTTPLEHAPEANSPEEAPEPQPTPAAETETAELTPGSWAELVRADSAASLDPEAPINANLRDRGVGFVPRVHRLDESLKAAYVACGAIEGGFRVPFGWHAIDDGRRVLVFDADNRMQISVNLRAWDGELEALGEALTAEYVQQQPDVETFAQAHGDIHVAGVRGLHIDGEVLNQGFVIRRVRDDNLVLVARATGAGDDIRLALNLAGDIVGGFKPLTALAATN